MPDTTASSSSKADSLITDLELALSTPAGGKSVLGRLERHARSRGFTSTQCQSLVNLALFGRTKHADSVDGIKKKIKPPRSSLAVAILRCVVPAPGSRIRRQVVLTILSILGPSPGTHLEEESGINLDQTDDFIGPERVKIDLRVQAAAIRLLSVLLDSPSVPLSLAASLDIHPDAPDESAAVAEVQGALPTSYMTLSARTTLEKCYAILFHFLDYQVVRPSLCYLLCRITKRKHVKHYRISKLMSLRANLAPEAGISALLSTYANFYPDLLFPELLGKGGSSAAGEPGRVPGLKYPDTEWLSRVLRCHARHVRRASGQVVDSDDEGGGGSDGPRSAKKARISLDGTGKPTDGEGAALPTAAIPNLVTVHPQSSLDQTLGSTPSLITELSSLRHLAHCLDRLTLPSQVAAMLGPNYGARLMKVAVLSGATVSNDVSLSQGVRTQIHAEDHCWIRLSDWLTSVVRDEIGAGSNHAIKEEAVKGVESHHLRPPVSAASLNHLSALLERARQLFDLSGEIPQRFESTICEVIGGLADVVAGPKGSKGKQNISESRWNEDWEGTCRLMISFVPHIKPASWDALELQVMEPLERLAKSPLLSEATSVAIVDAIASMLRNWGSREWLKIIKRLDRGVFYRWGISDLSRDVDYLETIANTIEATDRVVVDLFGRYTRSVALEHAALSFYEVIGGSLAGFHAAPRPSAQPLYALSISATSIAPVSRLFGLMRVVRQAYQDLHEYLRGRPSEVERARWMQEQAYFAADQQESMNMAVAVLADLIWRSKAFSLNESAEASQHVPELGFEGLVLSELKVRCDESGLKLGQVGAVTHSNVFVNLAERFTNECCVANDGAAAKREGWVRGPSSIKMIKNAKRAGLPNAWTHNKFRAELLDWLADKGAVGLRDLLTTIMQSLGANRGAEMADASMASAADTTHVD